MGRRKLLHDGYFTDVTATYLVDEVRLEAFEGDFDEALVFVLLRT